MKKDTIIIIIISLFLALFTPIWKGPIEYVGAVFGYSIFLFLGWAFIHDLFLSKSKKRKSVEVKQ